MDRLGDDPPRVKDLIRLIHFLFEEYVALKPHEYVALALWTLHSHVHEQFMHTPRLVVRSPVHGCGKTTLFKVLEKLTARSKGFDWITNPCSCV